MVTGSPRPLNPGRIIFCLLGGREGSAILQDLFFSEYLIGMFVHIQIFNETIFLSHGIKSP